MPELTAKTQNNSRMTAQQLLFQQLRENLPADISVADEVASLLYISTDSAYRRMRGETPLTTDELAKLCTHFNLSIDQLLKINTGKQAVFEINRVEYPHNSFEVYLQSILQQMQHINSFNNKEIIYVTKDIPLFHFFHSPEMLAFKHFFWMRTIVQHPDFASMSCDPSITNQALNRTAAEILRLYNEIPSIEVWNIESINSTLLQIEFYRNTNILKSAAAVKILYDALENAINHIEYQAEHGTKSLINEPITYKADNFKFFYNSVILADNTIFVSTDLQKKVFLNYGVLHYLSTSDEKFCESVHNDLQNLMRKSTLISSGGARQRSMFFNSLREKIDLNRNKL